MPELTLLYVHGESLGYGRYGVYLAKELERAGVDVYDHLQDPTVDASRMDHLNEGKQSKLTNVVAWVSVPTHARGWYEGQHSVISTMWESTSLPESFRESLHTFSTVIVPSYQNLGLFGAYHDNVHCVPLGVDPELWKFTPRTPHDREFRFLIGGSGSRKGTDLAYKAFRKVFRTWPADGPVPKLIMKSPKPEDFYGERIERIGGRISAEDEIALYEYAHCYLQPSRGEGFGLQPIQAMAQGLPTILTAAHGHDSFAHLGYGLNSTMKQSDYFIYGDAGEWWEPDFDQLCELMEYVYYNYDEAKAFAEVSAKTVAAEFTWEQTAQKFRAALGDELDKPYQGSTSIAPLWVEPELKKYLIITNKDWRADITGVCYQFIKGERYYGFADVKRILLEAGLLDPACLETIGPDGEVWDTGLTESQLAKLDTYCAENSYCESCGTKLNTGVSRADEIYAAMTELAEASHA